MASLSYIHSSAVIDGPGNCYRYFLERRWGPGPAVCFIMLNPSTADADVDDPTIRKCVGFAKFWGYEAILIVNLFAFRATDPNDLYEYDGHLVGPLNSIYIERAVISSDYVVAAWGTKGSYREADKLVEAQVTQDLGRSMHCLKLSKAGHPWHPLYVPYAQSPQIYKGSFINGG